MRCLITGGAGFLGTALANYMVTQGHTVRVLDDLSAGHVEYLHPDIHFTRGDVEDKPKVWRLLNKVDCVYHLAARVSVQESILYPKEYNTTNVSGTVAIMEAMRDAGVKRVVLASSGAIYGSQTGQAVEEDLLPNPTSPYAVSKLAAENYVHTIGQLWHIETVSLRIFNAYGPRQPLPPTHAPVIPAFLQQVLGKGSVIIHGDGNQVRDFIYVDDVVKALVKAATTKGLHRQTINIGTGVGTSINQLVDVIETVTDFNALRLVSNSATGGVSYLVADTQRAKKLLGFTAKTSLADGLAQLIKMDNRFHQRA